MMRLLTIAAIVACASAACPNDCGGHGVCGLSTQCECYRNWFGADCSLRVCSFGRAFVDSPVGDLNGDGSLNPSRSFSPTSNFKVDSINDVMGGNSELFDWQYGYARGSRTGDWDEAHFYRECSNKGVCDRSTGLCDCFPGYGGEGCARTACANDCSGHGSCRLISDSDDSYSAWDADATQQCVCDPGYEGPDCSMRQCLRGADPVEFAQTVTNSIQGIYWGNMDSSVNVGTTVYYTVTYADEFGDEWTTSLLSIDYASGSVDFTTHGLESQVEALNTSLLALPSNINSYVWGVNGADTGTDGANQYPSSSDATSPYVESLDFRLDASIIDANCDGSTFGVCFFVKIDSPGTQSALQVRYWYVGDGNLASISGASSNFGDASITNTDATNLVQVVDVQSNRQWNGDDGDVEYDFIDTSITSLDVCSKRGVCDYDTGLCDCFSGYSGLRCDDQNAIAYSY